LSSNFILAQYPAGKVVIEYLYSASLENELGEDPTRRITIYLPPGYNETTERYPVIYYLHGFTWNDSLQIADDRFDKLLDKAIAQGKIRPVIVVIPNHHTIYRGSWYTNSPLAGKWADFTAIDLVSYIDKNYRTLPDSKSRGITGHSMGGFGAIRLGMLFADVFSAVYALSPGGLQQPDVINKPRVLKIKTRKELLTRVNTWECLSVSMGRAFSPNPDNPPFFVDLPYYLIDDSLVVNEPVLKLWRQNAPFEMADHYIDNLKELTALKLDWGRNDKFSFIPIQSLMFSQKLDSLGIKHYAEEYLGMHSDKLWTDDGRALNSMLPFFDTFLTFQ
ncbi:MAG: alpha/beta hydrolase, partial [Bacteroidales bacterium]